MTILKYFSIFAISFSFLSLNYSMEKDDTQNNIEMIRMIGNITTQYNKLTLTKEKDTKIQNIKDTLFNENLQYNTLNNLHNEYLESLLTLQEQSQNTIQQSVIEKIDELIKPINTALTAFNNTKTTNTAKKISLLQLMLNKEYQNFEKEMNTIIKSKDFVSCNEYQEYFGKLKILIDAVDMLNNSFTKLKQDAFETHSEQYMFNMYHEACEKNEEKEQAIIVEYFEKLQAIKFKFFYTESISQEYFEKNISQQNEEDLKAFNELNNFKESINTDFQECLKNFQLEYKNCQISQQILNNPILMNEFFKDIVKEIINTPHIITNNNINNEERKQ